MPEFERKSQPLVVNGIDLNNPIDLMPADKFPILENVRSYQVGRLEPRAGQVEVNTVAATALSVHSIKRLNDPLPTAPQPFTRLIGAGTGLYSGTTAFTVRDTGYSGSPLSMVPWRPEQSPDSWCYVYDSLKLRKIRVDGLNYQTGIQAPLTAPGIALGLPLYTLIDAGAGSGYVAGGNAGAITTPTRVPAATTIGSIVYDASTTGWATIAPVNAAVDYSFMGEMIEVTLVAENVEMVEVRPALAATTIAAISYDVGTTGACCVQPTGSWTGLQRNSMVVIAGESVRVQSVTQAPDGSYSFRASTVTNKAAGNAIVIPASFRAYTVSNKAAGNAITALSLQSTLTNEGTGTITRTANYDLSKIGTRAIQPDDYFHISINIDNLDNVVQGSVMFDVDPATNDFTQNYFFKAFRPNDFAAALGGNGNVTVENARAIAIQRLITNDKENLDTKFKGNKLFPSIDKVPTIEEINKGLAKGKYKDYLNYLNVPANSIGGQPGLGATSSQQIGTGQSQWSELIFRASELIQVGTDTARTLANVKAWRFSLTVATTTVVKIAAFLYAGTYGPDQGPDSNPILYRYRYRSSLTGARSTPGPATRAGVLPRRGSVSVTTVASTDTQVDLIDIERFGGTLSDWHYVGTIPNGTGPFIDTQSDTAIAANPPLEIDTLLPFPSIDIPRSGVCTIVGTSVTRTSGTDTFNTSWAPGTPIKINGIVYTLYGQPSSTTRLQVVESGNSQAGVTFYVDEPVLLGQPLPCAWGPSNGFNFAVGDPRQPGVVRFTKGNDPDSAPEHYFVELTTPSDPLMNGVLYDGRSLVASTSRWFDLRPSGDIDNPIVSQELAIDRGLFASWAICVGGGRVWFLSDDGIYWTAGSGSTSITFKDLRPLFPHDDQPAIAVNGFLPPDFTVTEKLRLSWAASWLFFDYQDTAGNLRTLSYDTVLEAWWPDSFAKPVQLHYGDEGESLASLLLCSNNGKVYTFGGTSDAGTAIAGHFRTASMDYGDPRTRKLFGDLYLDADTKSISITVTPGFNNYTTLLTPIVLNTPTRQENPFDLLTGLGQLARDIALDFVWSSTTATPLFYEWECSVVNKPETSLKRATDWDDGGIPNSKYIRAVLIEADTLGIERTVTILKDGGVDSGNTLSVNNNGQELLPYPLIPFNSHLMRVYPTDADQWQLFRVTFIYDPYPENAAITGKWTDCGYPGAKWMQGVRLRADTSGGPVDVQIQGDGGVLQTTIRATHRGQEIVPYSWRPPFIAHLVRTKPLGDAAIWDVPDTDWVYEPMPELTNYWITQPTTHDLHGFGVMRWFYIAVIAGNEASFTITTEAGSTATFTIPPTGTQYRKFYYADLVLASGTWPLKGKAWTYQFTGGPIRLFLKDCEVGIKSFGASEVFEIKMPFGDVSRVSGAKI
jgi:hypothetical protein